MSRSIQENLVDERAPVLRVVEIIDSHRTQIALVHEGGRLIGTVTDGDVRRGILAGVPLDAPVGRIMNRNPVSAPAGTSAQAAVRIMRERSIYQLPLLDEAGRIVELKLLKDLWEQPRGENWVVLMAGGIGRRLRPLTDDCPKPLLKVGDKPIMETIIGNFVAQGFRRFFVTVNYKAEMIESYFGSGSRWDAEITYIRERTAMGTAGALALLPERPERPFFVMNADLLSKLNLEHLLKFHEEHDAPATMSVREYAFTVPYGVVRCDDHNLVQIDEKPVHKFFVNAGIYVLNPAIVDLLAADRACDMPHLFQTMIERGLKPAVFPLREYWIDVGQLDDLAQATSEFESIFS